MLQDDFLRKLPKLELHAHLNGSLSNESIQELGQEIYGENTKEFLQLLENLNNFEAASIDLNQCFEKFKIVHNLTQTPYALFLTTINVIRDFAKDEVIYLELRTTPKKTTSMSRKTYLGTVLDAIEKCQETYQSIVVKLIPSIDRSKPVIDAEETLDLILEMKENYSGLIVGLDLSGNPHMGQFKDFIPVLQKARENDLKLTLHCGEIDNQTEISEMIQFGLHRCGHGTFLNDEHLEAFMEKKIPIECCLTSNIKCNTVSSYKDHHFERIFRSGCPVVLCTDDSGVFDTTLTKELSIAKQTFNLTKNDFLMLTLNAIEHSFASEEEKKDLISTTISYFQKNK